MRTFEYLMEKYVREDTYSLQVPASTHKIARRNFVTPEEHDRILDVYRREHIPIKELARRFDRSVYCVQMIIRGLHKLSHAKKHSN